MPDAMNVRDRSQSATTEPMISVDARCFCHRCEDRTKDAYRMVGYCLNCKAEPILILYRAGDKSGDVDCPVCGNWHSVRAKRLATPDEVPSL